MFAPVLHGPVNAALIETDSPCSQVPPAQFVIDADRSVHANVVVVVLVDVVVVVLEQQHLFPDGQSFPPTSTSAPQEALQVAILYPL